MNRRGFFRGLIAAAVGAVATRVGLGQVVVETKPVVELWGPRSAVGSHYDYIIIDDLVGESSDWPVFDIYGIPGAIFQGPSFHWTSDSYAEAQALERQFMARLAREAKLGEEEVARGQWQSLEQVRRDLGL